MFFQQNSKHWEIKSKLKSANAGYKNYFPPFCCLKRKD
jgi:hypothetical protein